MMASAPEWRQDPLTERLVLISPERAERPLRPTSSCPFCEGHESETPPEVSAYRNPVSTPNGPGWRVRVVPNRYAAVRLDAARPPRRLSADPADGTPAPTAASPPVAPQAPLRSALGEKSIGTGVAEVFQECPHHETRFRRLTRVQVAEVFRSWCDRLRHWHDDGRLAFALLFKNEGRLAGASVEHCHSQLIGIPFVPPDVARELDHLWSLHGIAHVCPFCQWIERGRASERFVAESSRFAVFCPPAPRFPGESWIMPKTHVHSFESLADDKLLDLADALFDLLDRVDRVFDTPDFNLIVKTAPFRRSSTFHWRIELLPRTVSTAGWEWGTGLLINTMFPEHAARLLREAT